MKLKYPLLVLLVMFGSNIQAKPLFNITIQRNMTCSDGSTMGLMSVTDKQENLSFEEMLNGRKELKIGKTLELPWKNNETNISRVPAGVYKAKIRSDGKRKWRIELIGVTGVSGHERKNVQIHVGNYQRQIKGCVLVGKEIAKNGSACMVTHSKDTLNKLEATFYSFSASSYQSLDGAEIQVTIKD